ncbi:Fe-only nitrogenase subunit delta [Gorillibacterium timonense]|uniref:Fe-only nitrogenase subunit delta n=1 Tax=Gorillibacterium timonense TaxID=1689269 RepID=UPI00071D741A|nr:Fe-only nitrogenase subunit delta [Gorillibacterium timonense]
MDDLMKDRVAQLENYIMKKCLWQFHSRAWDRERQNERILTKTMQLLTGEPVDNSTPAERCYWVDAVVLAEAYQTHFPWIASMEKDAIKELMQALKDRIDYVTITHSLNEELTVKQY